MTHSLFDPSAEREHPQPNFRTLLELNSRGTGLVVYPAHVRRRCAAYRHSSAAPRLAARVLSASCCRNITPWRSSSGAEFMTAGFDQDG